MRSKAPLAMMEQMVMLLVFALAAALCLQAFVHSDQLSRQGEARDRAVVLCQNAAEVVRAAEGDFAAAAKQLGAEQPDKDSLQLNYTEDWSPAEDTMRYTLGAESIESDVSGLGKASVWLRDEATEQELFRVEVAWQEVNGHG